jgi:hypothetical protein
MNHVNPIEYVFLILACSNHHHLPCLVRVTQKVVAGVYQGVTTTELDVSRLYLFLLFFI